MTPLVAEEIEAYSEAHTTPAPEHLQALAQETRASLECPQMLTGPVEGRLLETLVWISRPQLIVADNTLRGGGVLDGDVMHAFNERVLNDPRTVCVLLPVRDGVTLIRLA